MSEVETLEWREFRNYSKRQAEFADVLLSGKSVKGLYGGAGFGGKSYGARSLIVELNGRYLKAGFPNQWGALFCSTYNNLALRHIAKLEAEMFALGKVSRNDKYGLHFRFHDKKMGGCYLLNVDEPDKYRSSEFAYALWDEATEGSREDFGLINYCIRSPLELPWLPFALFSNPDGPGHPWVRKLWIDKDFTGIDKEFNQEEFVFVAALPKDNPHWKDEMASTAFAGLSDAVRRARLTGSWDAVSGARFPQFDRRKHVFRLSEGFPNGIPSSWRRYRSIDYGQRAPYCCLWHAVDYDGNVWTYREDYQAGLTATEQATRILGLTSEQVELTYLDPACWQQIQDPLKQKLNLTIAKLYKDAGLTGLKPANNKRIQGWATMDNYLSDNGKPDWFIEEGCTNLIRQVASVPYDTRGELSGKREDIDPRAEDHALDAGRYFLHTRLYPTEMGVPLDSPAQIEKTNQQMMELIGGGDSAKQIRRRFR